jgi:hypothetical protein
MVESIARGLAPRYGTAVVLGLSLLAATVGRAAERPDFSGEWKRNPGQSQEWREKVEALTDPMAGRGDQPERRLFRSWLVRVLGDLESVEIEQSDTKVELVADADRVRIFYLGREHLRQSPEGLKIKTASGWVDGDFVIKQVTADGSTVTERLSMLGAGKQMAHLLRWEDSRLTLPLIIRTVFDRVE